MSDPYDDYVAGMITDANASLKRSFENHETFQCLRCVWHDVNNEISTDTCPNFPFYCTSMIRDVIGLAQEGECGFFEEASQ